MGSRGPEAASLRPPALVAGRAGLTEGSVLSVDSCCSAFSSTSNLFPRCRSSGGFLPHFFDGSPGLRRSGCGTHPFLGFSTKREPALFSLYLSDIQLCDGRGATPGKGGAGKAGGFSRQRVKESLILLCDEA